MPDALRDACLYVLDIAWTAAALAGSEILAIGWLGVFLVSLMFVMGVWNTAGGPSGGITFAILAATLTPTVAIPVQSIVEGVSGVYRSWTLRQFLNRPFLVSFALGGIGGVLVGFPLLSYLELSEGTVFVGVAAFMIVTTWVPFARVLAATAAAPLLVGVVTSFCSLFVGGMGAPISTALAGRGVGHYSVIATATTAVNFQYVARLVVFGFVGFSFEHLVPLMVLLTAGSLAGTWLGRKLLIVVDEDKARVAFNIAVTAIAAVLGLRGLRVL